MPIGSEMEPISDEVTQKVAEFLEIEFQRVSRKSPSFSCAPKDCTKCMKKLNFLTSLVQHILLKNILKSL